MPPKPMSRDRKGFFNEKKHEGHRSLTRPRYSSSHYGFHEFEQQRSSKYQQPNGRGTNVSTSSNARHKVPDKGTHEGTIIPPTVSRTIMAPRTNRDPRQWFWESSNSTSLHWHSKRPIDHVLKPFSHEHHFEDIIKCDKNDDHNNKLKHETHKDNSIEGKPIKWKHSEMLSLRETENVILLKKDVGGANDETTEPITAPRTNRDPRQRFWESSNNTFPHWHSKRPIDYVLKPFSHEPHFEDIIKCDKNDDHNNKLKHKTHRESPIEGKPIKWNRSQMFSLREPEKVILLKKDVGGANDDTTETMRKKLRLNWGEGLAKFEKKKNEVVTTVVNATTTTIPSSTCTSLAGVNDVLYEKATNLEDDVSNLEVSDDDICTLKRLGLSLVELLQYDTPKSTNSNLARSIIMTKVVLYKAITSKVLMATQNKIDSLESELQSILVCHNAKSCDEDIRGSNKVTCLKPLHIAPFDEDNVESLCNMIVSFNKDVAKETSEVFTELSPKECAKINDVRVSSNSFSPNDDALIKEKFVEKQRFSRFKEKVLTTKHKALSYLWEKDLSLRPLRKITLTSQKKLELGLQTINNGCQKKRSSIRNRFRFPVGNQLSLVPTTEMLAYTSELLSKSQDKVTRKILKMPKKILDQKDKMTSLFKSSNGLVEDPLAVEKERAMINPWTLEERNIFFDKFIVFGKDFRKIASFLDQKTTADCVEFYYKNHKLNCLEKSKKEKGGKSQKLCKEKTSLVAASKKRKCKVNVESQDVFSEALMRENSTKSNRRTRSGRLSLWRSDDNAKISTGDDSTKERPNNHDILEYEGESVAVEVLVGKFGSISPMGSCSFIARSVDHMEANKDKTWLNVGIQRQQPLMLNVTENIDDGTFGMNYDKIYPSDCINKEKASFLPIASSVVKNFPMITQTRSKDQCKNIMEGPFTTKNTMLQNTMGAAVQEKKTGHVEDTMILQCHPFKELVNNQVLTDISSINLTTELPLLSQKVKQNDDLYKMQSQHLLDLEKRPKNVVFKLFGKIVTIPSSSHNPDLTTKENEENDTN